MIKFFRQIRQTMINENRTKKYLLYAIGEIILVVVGILIALGINNWNNNRESKAVVKDNLLRIEREIINNQDRIKKVFDYHVMVKDTINKVNLPEAFDEVSNKLGFWRGHQIFRLQDAAFQSAIQSGVSKDINLELLEQLNKLYNTQIIYNDLSQSVTQGLYDLDFESAQGFKKITNLISMTMQDVYYLETELLTYYKSCLESIESIKN